MSRICQDFVKSKKKPDQSLNELKVKMINKILEKIKEILSIEPGVEFLDLLDNEILPSNSDAVLILAQYIEVMKQFDKRFHRYDEVELEYGWVTKKDP